jgi:hypothetical protein
MADKNKGTQKASPSEALCKCKDNESTGKTRSKTKAKVNAIGSPMKTRSRTKAMVVALPVQSLRKSRSNSKASASASKSRSNSKASASASKSRSSSKAPASASKSRSSSKAPASPTKSRSSSKASASPVKAPRKSKTTKASNGKQRVSRKRVYKPISKSRAKQAFKEYYANRDYSSEARRNAAIKRDLNSSPRNASKYLVKDERYLLNPGRYDFKGVDAGPNVSKYSGNLAALKLAHKAPRSGRRSHSQVLKEIKRSK